MKNAIILSALTFLSLSPLPIKAMNIVQEKSEASERERLEGALTFFLRCIEYFQPSLKPEPFPGEVTEAWKARDEERTKLYEDSLTYRDNLKNLTSQELEERLTEIKNVFKNPEHWPHTDNAKDAVLGILRVYKDDFYREALMNKMFMGVPQSIIKDIKKIEAILKFENKNMKRTVDAFFATLKQLGDPQSLIPKIKQKLATQEYSDGIEKLQRDYREAYTHYYTEIMKSKNTKLKGLMNHYFDIYKKKQFLDQSTSNDEIINMPQDLKSANIYFFLLVDKIRTIHTKLIIQELEERRGILETCESRDPTLNEQRGQLLNDVRTSIANISKTALWSNRAALKNLKDSVDAYQKTCTRGVGHISAPEVIAHHPNQQDNVNHTNPEKKHVKDLENPEKHTHAQMPNQQKEKENMQEQDEAYKSNLEKYFKKIYLPKVIDNTDSYVPDISNNKETHHLGVNELHKLVQLAMYNKEERYEKWIEALNKILPQTEARIELPQKNESYGDHKIKVLNRLKELLSKDLPKVDKQKIRDLLKKIEKLTSHTSLGFINFI